MDRNRLAKLFDEHPDKKRTHLSKLLTGGQDPTVVTKILKGARQIKLREADIIRDFFGEPVGEPEGRPIQIDTAALPADLPVSGQAVCGPDGAFEFESQISDRVRRPPRLLGVRDAYALYVLGESMAPWRENGQLVFIHPGVPPRVGDYVVIQLKPKDESSPPQAYIKRLIGETDREYRFQQYNPAKALKFPKAQVYRLHRILQDAELLGA